VRVEGGDLPFLVEQHVVEREDLLAVGRRPVVRVGGLHQDGAGEAHLQAVVAAGVRVVPVQPGVGELQDGGEVAADRDGVLREVGAVVAVVETQPVPVHGGGRLGVVLDVDGGLAA
jgi:hypothetical protein